LRLLLLATGFAAQYRALRCAAALGAEVHVLGAGPARSLALSRYCKSFRCFAFNAADEDAAARLDGIAKDLSVDRVLPADLTATQFLARVNPHLKTACFPLSDPQTIEALGSKDSFMTVCRRLGILHPEGTVITDRAALVEALNLGRIRLPAVLKPIDRAGGIGVVQIDGSNAMETAARIDYEPILAQQFIPGIDRCITVFCREGRIRKQVIYEHQRGHFRFLEDPALARLVAGIAAALNLTGVINFDARIDADGRIWMIECNPRFYFNMDVAMVAGLNFADWNALSSGVQSVADQEIRIPNAFVRAMLHWKRASSTDLKMLTHWLKDPLMFALVALGYQRRWHLPILESVVTRHKCAI
jgi:ATP-grasp in the biosynthetic pathway with Ter operon